MPRFNDATTAPVFGAMVSVLSELETEFTPPIHVLLSAKQPAERLIPTFDVVVACPRMLSPRTVVVPNPPPAISRAEMVVVAKVLGDEVARYKFPLIERKVQGALVREPSVSASCGPVEEETVRAH